MGAGFVALWAALPNRQSLLAKGDRVKVERDAILTCSNCRVEGAHELLYLSQHLRASRCVNCGYALAYSPHIYAEYARDVAGRTARVPRRFVGGALRAPVRAAMLPFKALRKSLRLLKEAHQVTLFERSHRQPPVPGRRV
jgi:hypothetical protein